MQRRLIYIFVALLGFSIRVFSQTESSNINPSHFFSFAPTLRTNGFGINFKWGYASQHTGFNFYSIDFGKTKHQKEFRYLGNGQYNGYIFGRKNVAIPLNIGFGKYFVLGVRNGKNDVGVAWTYQFGASIVFLKPVYLYIEENPGAANSTLDLIKYDGEGDQFNIDIDNIMGGAPFFTGLNQMQAVPGLFGKTSVLFSWGKYYNDYHAVEMGALAEVYKKELPLMAKTNNSFFYPSFFINFNLGKFW